MQDQRIGAAPSQQTQRIEAAILALLLAEDHPWRVSELGKTLRQPPGLVHICVARLHADGLVTYDEQTTRASRAAVRADELGEKSDGISAPRYR
jgi:DNA-binding IclR family transcriptional regulator